MCGLVGLEHSSVVLGGSRAFVRGGHVVHVTAVFVPAVVEGLALEKSGGWRQVGDGGYGQVVVRRGVLLCVREVLLGRVRVMWVRVM